MCQLALETAARASRHTISAMRSTILPAGTDGLVRLDEDARRPGTTFGETLHYDKPAPSKG